MTSTNPSQTLGSGDRVWRYRKGRAANRPGWPEMATTLVAYVVLVVAGVTLVQRIPMAESVFRGLGFYALSALAAFGAFVAAAVMRIRRWSAFGVHWVSAQWLLLGACLGMGVWLLNIGLVIVDAVLAGHASHAQAIYAASANDGAPLLLLTFFFGAIATPVGEELAFRGVIAHALERHGVWIGVGGSALIFSLTHGLNIGTPVAFVVGVISALLLRRTGSIWPGVFMHGISNGMAILAALLIS